MGRWIALALLLVCLACGVCGVRELDTTNLPPTHELHTYTLGPYDLKAMVGGSFAIPRVELPGSADIQFWGNWVIYEEVDGTKTELPQGTGVFLHHIMLYDGPHGFVGGCSDERSTFGPNFKLGSPYVFRTAKTSYDAHGSVYMVSFLNRDAKIHIGYEVVSYKKQQSTGIPLSCKAYFDMISLPQPLPKEPEYYLEFPMEPAGNPNWKLVTALAHGHVGGRHYDIYDKSVRPSKKVCSSTFHYHTDPLIPMFIELPERNICKDPNDVHSYPALKFVKHCDFSGSPDADLPVLVSGKAFFKSYYDTRCLWAGCHAQIYTWGHTV